MNDKTRDELQDELLTANQSFYDAFATGKFSVIEKLWAIDYEISVTHPGQQTIYGHEAVMDSWRHILGDGRRTVINCESAKAFEHGVFGYVTCVEVFPEGELTAVNIYIQERGQWKMVYHQAGPSTQKSGDTARVLH